MSSPPSFNPEQFKISQRKMWDNAAKGWQEWWQTFEHGAQVVSNKLVEIAGIMPGDRVLDVATGIGEPAVTAARRVGQKGKVVATDLSAQMIATAKSRAKSVGLDGIIEFVEIDAEHLDFPEASFNAVLSRWGLMFLPNLPAALARIRKILVPQGRLAAAVWAAPPKVPVLDVVFSTVNKQIGAKGPPPSTPGPFSLANTDALKMSFVNAGFKDVQLHPVTCTFNFESPSAFTAFHQQIAAPVQLMLASYPDEKKKQVWDAVTDEASAYADSHGRVSMDSESVCVVGTK